MGGIIWFYKPDGALDTTHEFIECDTDDEYNKKVKELEGYGYIKGVDFK